MKIRKRRQKEWGAESLTSGGKKKRGNGMPTGKKKGSGRLPKKSGKTIEKKGPLLGGGESDNTKNGGIDLPEEKGEEGWDLSKKGKGFSTQGKNASCSIGGEGKGGKNIFPRKKGGGICRDRVVPLDEAPK